jgi:CubicO group peptidase (beta-lactamase class C family)
MSLRFLLFTLLSVLTVRYYDVQAQPVSKIVFDCRDSIPLWLARYNVPLMAIGIIENNRIKKTVTYGQPGNRVQTWDNSLFNVASLTKPVFAVTVLKLVCSGQWDLDSTLSEYWTDPDVKGNPWHDKLTARIILSHQTGFSNWRDLSPSKRLFFNFEPGTRFGYSGEGYEYLRHAVESKFGKSIQQISDSLVFRPLGMKDTRYGWDSRMDSSRFALPHKENGELVNKKKIAEICAADWLVTTIRDYSKFCAYVLKKAGLGDPLFREMVTPQVQIADDPGDGMGLGWEVIRGLPGGEYVITHTGHDYGVTTLVMLLPLSGRGIIMLTNGENGFDVIALAAKAMLRIKKLDPYLDDL